MGQGRSARIREVHESPEAIKGNETRSNELLLSGGEGRKLVETMHVLATT
jgi:hypothetical protein